MALVTVDDIRNDRNFPSGLHDEFLDDLISVVTEEIVAYCNQPILAETITNYEFDGTGTDRYTFPFTSVRSVGTFAYRTGIGSGTTWTTIATTDYSLVTQRGVNSLHYFGTLQRGARNYRCSALAVGYLDADIPMPIKRVAREMVIVMALKSNRIGLGENSLGLMSHTENYPNGVTIQRTRIDLTPEWNRRLDPYRALTL
jgi:hypothetical protein